MMAGNNVQSIDSSLDSARASLFDNSDSTDLREICSANGISRQVFADICGFSVKKLELVLLGFSQFQFLTPYFHGLTGIVHIMLHRCLIIGVLHEIYVSL